jgi:hypothetical protein
MFKFAVENINMSVNAMRYEYMYSFISHIDFSESRE